MRVPARRCITPSLVVEFGGRHKIGHKFGHLISLIFEGVFKSENLRFSKGSSIQNSGPAMVIAGPHEKEIHTA